MSAAGRSCPVRYHYGAAAIAHVETTVADTLYVVGGLYGNPFALDALEVLLRFETGNVHVCFNGDFNWFNATDADFRRINERILGYDALMGNVEAELGETEATAGCGCAYPASVDDAVVERSNRIHARLKATAQRHPDLLARLASLPMVRRYRVGGLHIGVVHGDFDHLAGWTFDVESVRRPETRASILAAFQTADVQVFASSHTCLPVCEPVAPNLTVINNGAAGMPNFAGTQFGIVTRISHHPAPTDRLYGIEQSGMHVDALALRYDANAWRQHFLATWPAGSDAHTSYFDRIEHGPAYLPETAQPPPG